MSVCPCRGFSCTFSSLRRVGIRKGGGIEAGKGAKTGSSRLFILLAEKNLPVFIIFVMLDSISDTTL